MCTILLLVLVPAYSAGGQIFNIFSSKEFLLFSDFGAVVPIWITITKHALKGENSWPFLILSNRYITKFNMEIAL